MHQGTLRATVRAAPSPAGSTAADCSAPTRRVVVYGVKAQNKPFGAVASLFTTEKPSQICLGRIDAVSHKAT